MDLTKEDVWDAIAEKYAQGGTSSAGQTNTKIKHVYGDKNVSFAKVHNELLSNGWIVRAGHPFRGNNFQISKEGLVLFNEYGSYSAWKKHKQSVEKLQHSKLLSDEKLSRLKLKTFWWLFAFAILGAGYSAFDFIRNLSIGEYDQHEQIPTTEMELEQSIQHISPLDQKSQDSSFVPNSDIGIEFPKMDTITN